MKKLIESQPPFNQLLGTKIISASKNQLFAEMVVKKEFSNRNGVMHGGAIMAFADNLGGTATFIKLEEGLQTTTIESKTNFFRPIKIGSKIRARCDILKSGKKIIVIQTTIFRADKKIAAVIIQTQMILKFEK